MNLNEGQEKTVYKIDCILENPEIQRKIELLGFRKNADIEILSKSQNELFVKVNNNKVSVDNHFAGHIIIE